MAKFKSYSQSGQDRFAYEVLGRKTDGTFLDVGAGHVIEKSNSYGLEQIGWRGLCVDLNPQGDIGQRRCEFVSMDATQADWKPYLASHWLWPEIDYLSLDIDGATLDALKRLPLSELKFKVITCEHDRYRFGDGPRNVMRGLLAGAGYDLVCANVCDRKQPFEDWWVAESISEMAAPFRCVGKDWKDIMV